MLTQKDFIQALSIISDYHTTQILINKPKDSFVDTSSEKVRLEIIDCVPAVINQLKRAGYSLSMNSGKLLVDKW